jgi:cysteine-rich repeat protein
MGGYQASMSLAQSLTVGRTGLLTKLRFWTQSLGSDTTCFRVEVRDGTGGPLLGAQDVCVPAIFGTLPNAVVATFDVPVPLAAGQAVTIGFVPTSGGASIAVLWRSTDAYAGGTALVGGYPYPADFALDTWVADPGGCAATCGDGVVQSIEGCDEADTVAGDGCSDHCDEEACGDGIVQPDLGEACDDGLANGDHGACAPDCSGPGDACGDGVLNGDEACDWGDANVPGVGVCTDQCLCHGDPVAQVEVLPDGSGGFVAQAGGQDLVQGVVPTADGLLTTWSFPTTPFQTGTSCLRFAILEDALGAYGSLAETVRCWDQVYGSGTTWATVDLDPPLAVAAGVPRTVRVRHESGVAMQLLRADGSYRVSNVDAGLAFHAWVAPYEDCPAP